MHLEFGGSTAPRTKACPAWHNIGKNMPAGPASMAALKGTLGHLLFERGIIDEDFEPQDMLGERRMIDGTELVVEQKDIDKVYTALDVFEEVEDKYDFDETTPEVFASTSADTGGTADLVSWTLKTESPAIGSVELFGVGDLKTGDGYMVYAEKNEQLLFYAWQMVEKYKGTLRFTEDTIFLLYIIQPSDRRDDPLDVWETDLATILKFAREYTQSQKEAKAGILTPCPGKHCSYCPALSVCPAKTGLVAVAQRLPAKSDELRKLQEALGVVDEMEDWCKAVRKVAHEQAEAGVKIKGFKLVNKRATRKWEDEAAAMKKFKNARGIVAEDYLDQSLKSAPQMEKVCKSKGIDFKKYESMITLHSSGTTLVKSSDKRQEALPLKALAAMAAQIK